MGQEFWISNLSFQRTYAGQLEGSQATISSYRRQDDKLSADMKEEFPYVESVLVIDDGAPELPHFEWRAVLESGAIKSESEDSMSRMGIVWFTDTFTCDLPDLLKKLIGSIDWAAEAHEFDYSF